jgi:hypothetical protein
MLTRWPGLYLSPLLFAVPHPLVACHDHSGLRILYISHKHAVATGSQDYDGSSSSAVILLTHLPQLELKIQQNDRWVQGKSLSI